MAVKQTLEQLVIRLEGTIVQRITLTPEGVRIGRFPDNDLVLPHPDVSRHHAELRREAGGHVLTDLGSLNGTYIEGERVPAQQPRPLVPGRSIQIGPFYLHYEPQANTPEAMDPEIHSGTHVISGAEPSPLSEKKLPAIPAIPAIPIAKLSQPPTARPPRCTWPAPLAEGPASRYFSDLPVPLQESEFLSRFLLIFESIWEPLEQRQNAIQMYFDPRTCPGSFLPWLARWLDISFNAHWPETRRRRLVAEAMELHRWRGTAYGLTRVIELCTGLTPEISEADGEPFVFRVRVQLPPDRRDERAIIEELICAHKPAHAGYFLEVE